jgi:F-type H+-transporting ATPase subunit epsilon
MNLRICLPSQLYLECDDVSRIVVETEAGSYGLLPHRLDCVAALVAGILIYETAADGEVYVAVDHGVLVKAGALVRVSVRRAHLGRELDSLREEVVTRYRAYDERERSVQSTMMKLETAIVRRLGELST